MNHFKISDSFPIKAKNLFVFAGVVVEGVAASGMTFQVPEAGHSWTLRVKSVELITRAVGGTILGLIVEYGSPGYLPGLGVGWTATLVADGESGLADSNSG